MPAYPPRRRRPANQAQVDLHDPQKFCNWFRPQMENIAHSHRAFANYLAGQRAIRWNPFVYV